MFDPNQPLPDFQTQQLELERKRAMAELLRKQSSAPMPTGQMVGNRFVAPSLAQYLPGLLNAAQSAYAQKQAGDAEKAYGQQVAQAKQQWASSLPQTVAAVPGREELYGPQAEGGSPELAAVPEIPAQRPDTSSILKATLAGLNIPGNEKVAGLWNQGMLADMTREDNQTFRKESETARLTQERELRLAQLAQQKAIADQNAANTAASIEQRKAADEDSARLKELMIQTQAEGRRLVAAVRAAGGGGGDDNAAAGKGTMTVRDESGKLTTVTKADAVRRGLVEVKNDIQMTPQEIQKREALFPKAKQAVQSVSSTMDTLAQDLETLASHPGLSGITGTVFGRTPSALPSSLGANALLEKIMARGGLSELTDLKASGATLGQVSNAEGERLKAAFGELNTSQSTADMKTALIRAANRAKEVKLRAEEAYNDTYEYRDRMSPDRTAPPGKPGTPPALSPQDAQALEWANSNPNDPRAAAIRQRLKVQ
jgi:hypothetical protein